MSPLQLCSPTILDRNEVLSEICLLRRSLHIGHGLGGVPPHIETVSGRGKDGVVLISVLIPAPHSLRRTRRCALHKGDEET